MVNKYVNIVSQFNKLVFDYLEKSRNENKPLEWFKNNARRLIAKDISKISNWDNIPNSITDYVSKYYDIFKTALSYYGLSIKDITLTTDSYLTINRSGGMGYAVYEIGISLHDILGIPFIPSASFKGAFRYAFKEVGNELNIKNIIDAFFDKIRIFYFSDLYPVGIVNRIYDHLIVPDIINPHYTLKTKDETKVQPRPLIHLVINEGVKFRLIFGYKEKEFRNTIVEELNNNSHAEEMFRKEGLLKNSNIDIDKLLNKVLRFICEMGVGGKTRLGYSTFILG